eukprot:gene41518-56168_t
MENNLFSDIVTSKLRYSCQNKLWADSDLTLIDEVYGGSMTLAYSNSISNLTKCSISDHTFSISIDSVERCNEDSSNSLLLIGAGYISYGLTIIRGEDLMKQTIWKRFKEIAAFHAEVSTVISSQKGKPVEFPKYGDNWLTSKPLDPQGEFVQRRRLDLQ